MNETSNLVEELSSVIEGDVTTDDREREQLSRDTSLFSITPSVIVYPKNTSDVSRALRIVRYAKENGENVSITPRAAGTDMTGGPLTSSVLLVFTKYMNRIFDVSSTKASAEPGVYYRDFEKETLKKGALLPSFPASREICALGGMVANNSGGELTLKYGKTERYIEELDVVLSDGSIITTRPLTENELESKKELQTLEGKIYREIDSLINENKELIENARPQVSKNSSGYSLWNVRNDKNNTFDLSQLIIGSQGTLGIITKIRTRLISPKKDKSMVVIFLSDIKELPEVVRRVLKLEPESFESYDDNTFSLALRFFPQIIKQLGLKNILGLGLSFLPEVRMAIFGGIPKLILMAEFAEDSMVAADKKSKTALEVLKDLNVRARITPRGIQTEKYWIVRRESFSLLRKNTHGLYAAPFIDDLVIPTDSYPSFLPKLKKLLEEYDLLYTIAGHIGDGNLHIIPLVDLSKQKTRKMILELTPKIYKLTLSHGGSITGEHNDGIIRTPYISLMFGSKVLNLFEKVKDIFDPLDILNPNKKVNGKESDINKYLINHA